MDQGLTALGGVIVGLLTSEYFRRRGRQESYASVIFPKRLAAYEAFDKKVNELNDLAATLVNDDPRELTEREASWQAAKIGFFNFVFDNRLYLSADVAGHAGGTLAGVNAILATTDPDIQEKRQQTYNKNMQQLREMIRSDSGAQRSESLLRRIFKARHHSDFIDYMNKNRGPW
jgi:hypothetical protein